MICPTCKAVVEVLEGTCPSCLSEPTPITIIESTPMDAASSPYHASASLPPTLRLPTEYALQRRQPLAHPVLASLPRLPALLWRQPIVRASVRTGASAVALSLALRMAGRLLTNRTTSSPTNSTILPALADLFASPESTARRPTRRRPRHHAAHEGEAVETLIYIRRVFHNAP